MARRFHEHRDLAIAALVFLAAAGFNYAVMTFSTGIMESHHGRFHAAYVYQIFHGIIPPTNVHAAGEPANFYWPWHLWVAAIMKVAGIAPFEANAYVGSAAFGTTVLALYLLARRLGMGLGFGLCLPLFTLGMHRLVTLVASLLGQGSPRGASPRLTSTADKFLNLGSFPTAFAAFALAFHWELSSRWRGARLTPWYWVSVLVMGFFSPIVLFVYDLWLALVIVTQFHPSMSWSDVRSTSRREFSRYWPMLLCHLVVAPFILRVGSLMGGSTSIAQGAAALAVDLARMQSTLWVFAVAFGAGLYLHYRRFRATEPDRTRWLVWSAPFGLLLFLLMELPDGNEYKIVLLWSLPLGLAIVFAANELVRERGNALRLAVLLVLLACGSGSILGNAWARTHSRMAKLDPWVFRGVATELKGQESEARLLQQAADWIRANTDATDYLLAPSQRWDRTRFPLLTQRRIVAARPSLHTVRLPNHPRLFELNEHLLAQIRERKRWIANEDDRSTADLVAIVGDEQAIFAVVRKTEPGRWPSHPSLVYQNPLYAILTPAGPDEQIPVEIQQLGVVPYPSDPAPRAAPPAP